MDRTVALRSGWQLAHTPPQACATPDALPGFPAQWHDAAVPGTVAASLHDDINAEGDYDADDWWYRTTFAKPDGPPGTRYRLRLDGLATLAQVWLNGREILASRNMFVGHRLDVSELLVDVNQLAIVFRALGRELAQRRVRPRWKTALVSEQNLRWFRTTLLGRMPGWTPPITPVGPWQPIALECFDRVELGAVELQARAEGSTGRLQFRAEVKALRSPIEGARLRLGDALFDLERLDAHVIRGDLAIENAPLWYPHTHGAPALLPCALELLVDGEWLSKDCGAVGFKELALDTSDGKVQFVVNGLPVFARGACWTTADFLTLRGDPARLRQALTLARDAGVNMLRIGGTMVYESDDFYRLCDELGLLVWQDFMFANMDYPVGDAGFREEIEREAEYQLGRLQRHACIAAYCGGSEVAQQAAMLGLAREQWSSEFFSERLPQLIARLHAATPYFPSSPWGGALPIHVSTGISHYYGVGAYRRPLMDVKVAKVKFAAECLGFSNVPDAETMALILDGTMPPPHHPRWKARVPRDNGAGYDFEDVRDHYLKELFGKDAIAMRNQDLERYYAVSRVVTGEVMGRVYSEWRAAANPCGGALVWFFRDLVPGAGWGVTDSEGRPKSAYWYLKRAWAARTVRLTDEGLDGLGIHVINESAETLDALIELEMFQSGRIPTASAEATLRVAPRGSVTLQGDALLGYFSDATNAYRFGPPKHDVIVVRLKDAATGAILAEDFHFPAGLDLPAQRVAAVKTEAAWREDGCVAVTLRSDVFLQAVAISCNGYSAGDNYFHLAPSRDKTVIFTPETPGAAAFKAHFEALNWPEPITVRLAAAAAESGAQPSPLQR
jgi:beta-mannosidase